jgi:hypothetical protein
MRSPSPEQGASPNATPTLFLAASRPAPQPKGEGASVTLYVSAARHFHAAQAAAGRPDVEGKIERFLNPHSPDGRVIQATIGREGLPGKEIRARCRGKPA